MSVLIQAALSVFSESATPPPAQSVVEALLHAEKAAKKQKVQSAFEQLIGSWRLCFITGTKKSRSSAGVILGAGRYIPRWLQIQLSYQSPSTSSNTGTVANLVRLGSLSITLSGPVKFLPPQNILAFDFTQIKVQLFGVTLYQGKIRGGDTQEQFYQEKIKKQAFFVYFLIEEKMIAARGRGGGLALWGRQA